MSGRSSLSGIGSVEKTGRKNTWRIRVALGKDPVTGKYRKVAQPHRARHQVGGGQGADGVPRRDHGRLGGEAERHHRRGQRGALPRGARGGHGTPSGSSPCSPQTFLVPVPPSAARRVVQLTDKTHPQVRIFGRVCNSPCRFCPVLLGSGRFIFRFDSNYLARFRFTFAACRHAAFSLRNEQLGNMKGRMIWSLA